MGYSTFNLFTKHRLIYKDAVNWRLTKRIPGAVNGLPASLGILVATNGILCLIETGNDIYEGHLQWFIAQSGEDQQVIEELKVNHYRKTTKPKIDVNDYAALIEL